METEEKSIPLSIVDRQAELDVICREVYLCKFCGEFARQPVLNVICGHLFCWCCLYRDVKHKSRKGLRQCCPWCSSHLAIFPPEATIIRVCGGPESGAVCCVNGIDYPQMEKAKEVEEKLKVKGVPRRPWYEDTSRYPSLSQHIGVLFIRLNGKIMDICWSLESLHSGKVVYTKERIEFIRKKICKLVRIVEDAGLWSKGHEGSGFPKSGEAVEEEKIIHGKHKGKGKGKVKKRPIIKMQLSWQSLLHHNLRRKKKQRLWKYLDEQPADHRSFSCTICHKIAYEPVVSKSGHLFCWTCLHNKGEYPSVGCPITELSDSIVVSYITVSPIYYGMECEEENTLLIANRPTDKQRAESEAQIPSRANPKVIFAFLDYMICKVKEEVDEIIKVVDEVGLDLHDNLEKGEICRELQGRLNAFLAWLINVWCETSKERESDKKFGPRNLTHRIEKDKYYEMAYQELVYPSFGLGLWTLISYFSLFGVWIFLLRMRRMDRYLTLWAGDEARGKKVHQGYKQTVFWSIL